MQTKYKMLITEEHYKTIQGKIFKIMPLFEEENSGLSAYINSVIYEFEGLRKHLNKQQDSMMQTIISILEHFYDDSLAPTPDLIIIRTEWHGIMTLVKKMSEHGDRYG